MNTTNGTAYERHELELSPCCPVSKNPRPGSRLIISYRPCGYSLEIASLYAYIHQFRGGLYNDNGCLIVRDMEGMLLCIAADCAQMLGVSVRVYALLNLAPRQTMRLSAKGYPVE